MSALEPLFGKRPCDSFSMIACLDFKYQSARRVFLCLLNSGYINFKLQVISDFV